MSHKLPLPRNGIPFIRSIGLAADLAYALRMRLAAVCALAILLLAASSAHAEDALVLSGGGARGLAHAGALVGVEQRGYDPDIVVGTSMGAILGGLYAAGYGADSVWNIVTEQ